MGETVQREFYSVVSNALAKESNLLDGYPPWTTSIELALGYDTKNVGYPMVGHDRIEPHEVLKVEIPARKIVDPNQNHGFIHSQRFVISCQKRNQTVRPPSIHRSNRVPWKETAWNFRPQRCGTALTPHRLV